MSGVKIDRDAKIVSIDFIVRFIFVQTFKYKGL